ncbi:uncharacterized protein CTRU02_211786 [Colletotrichum truncatum]|uniref:Uncharacterized protein n=1 Tax=Colletotrichum truncatum TaxID=5467 RepID=A0ACC3YLN2_COLTU|nr:uncharacterized protein CTRU02_07195 [Colletotrichum truncatum]KAF6791433.1 hypothetical protein CTRU02_07195 [Colletotrichum truncatum]
MDRAPFPKVLQLCSELSVAGQPRRLIKVSDSETSTTSAGKTSGTTDYFPGQPWLRLQDQQSTITQFLRKDIVTDDLDKLAPHMWLLATQRSDHVSSLTHQQVRGRKIVVTENPGLHLTWIYERVFVKPLPEYLLSHAFWDYYLVGRDSPISASDREAILRAAKGFLRSYAFLIRHKADYLLATHEDNLELVPKSISFSSLVEFLRCFEGISDAEVSPRYMYGDLRLTRVNFWAAVFLRRSRYFKSHGQYGAYFAQYYGPILFVFGGIAIALGAMQVVLAVDPGPASENEWIQFSWMSRGFSVFVLCLVLILTLAMIAELLFLVLREVIYATRHRYQKIKAEYASRNDVEMDLIYT